MLLGLVQVVDGVAIGVASAMTVMQVAVPLARWAAWRMRGAR